MSENPDTPPVDLEEAFSRLREAHNILCDRFSRLEKDVDQASTKTRSKLDFLLKRIQQIEGQATEDE